MDFPEFANDLNAASTESRARIRRDPAPAGTSKGSRNRLVEVAAGDYLGLNSKLTLVSSPAFTVTVLVVFPSVSCQISTV